MKRMFFIIVVLFLTASCGYCQEAEQPFQLTIRSDTQVYGVGEDIIIEVIHKNKSNHDVELEDFYPDIDEIGHRSKFRFTVYKDKSNTQQQYNHVELFKKMSVNFERRQMKPGEEIVFKVTLNKWYDMSKPGRYSVGCMKTHQFPREKIDERQLPIGKEEMFQFKATTYVSNTITIEVVEKKPAISIEKAIEIAKEYALERGENLADYKEPTATYRDDSKWVVDFIKKDDPTFAVEEVVDPKTGLILLFGKSIDLKSK